MSYHGRGLSPRGLTPPTPPEYFELDVQDPRRETFVPFGHFGHRLHDITDPRNESFIPHGQLGRLTFDPRHTVRRHSLPGRPHSGAPRYDGDMTPYRRDLNRHERGRDRVSRTSVDAVGRSGTQSLPPDAERVEQRERLAYEASSHRAGSGRGHVFDRGSSDHTGSCPPVIGRRRRNSSTARSGTHRRHSVQSTQPENRDVRMGDSFLGHKHRPAGSSKSSPAKSE